MQQKQPQQQRPQPMTEEERFALIHKPFPVVYRHNRTYIHGGCRIDKPWGWRSDAVKEE